MTPQVELQQAVTSGDLKKVRVLLDAGANPLQKDEQGRSSLQLAMRTGRERIIDALVKAAEGWSLSAPLTIYEAAEYGLLAKVRQLIVAGADVNASGPSGWTPLRVAASRGHLEIVRLLMSAGASLGADPESAAEWMLAPATEDLIRLGSAVHPQAWNGLRATWTLAVGTNRAFEALEQFPASAKLDAFRAAVSLVEECTGIRARPWRKCPGVVIFEESSAEEILRQQIRRAGHQLIVQNANLLLFPTSDKFAVIASCGTHAVNYGLTSRDMVRELIEFDHWYPFTLHGCGSDWLEGQLAGRPDDETADTALRRLSTFCPDLASDRVELAHASWQLRGTGRFRLWWD